jgi:hypothetical protein
MNLEDARAKARATLASYLVGGPVTVRELSLACDVLSSDEGYYRHLTNQLGLTFQGGELCDRFRARVAEFSELSPADRRIEMPEFASHVVGCVECRNTYWGVKDLWSEGTAPAAAASTPRGAQSVWRTLAEGIRLGVDSLGRLSELVLGPPTAKMLLVTASDRPKLSVEKEWLLRDEELGCTLRIVVLGRPNGKTYLQCSLEAVDDPGLLAAAGKARLTVIDAATGKRRFDGLLSECQLEPIALPLGSIRILLQLQPDAATSLPPMTWDIPLTLERR